MGLVIVLIVVGVLALVTLPFVLKPQGLHSGAGTATFTWTSVDTTLDHPKPQPFTGTIDGLALSGTADQTPKAFIGSIGSPSRTDFPFEKWTGELGGTRFEITVKIKAQGSGFGFSATGIYGSSRTSGMTEPDHTCTSARCHTAQSTLPFSGTVGSVHFSGLLRSHDFQKSGRNNTLTVTFVVTSGL